MKGYVYVDKKKNTYQEISEFNFSVEESSGERIYYVDLCDRDSNVIFSLPLQRTMYFYLKQSNAITMQKQFLKTE